MSECDQLASSLTAWVDGEAADEVCRAVEAHLARCPACRERAHAEQSVRALLHRRASALTAAAAPIGLRDRCRAVVGSGPLASPTAPLAWWRARLVWLPAAAVLVLAVAVVAFYGVAAVSTTAFAANLTLDHHRCFRITQDPGAPVDPAEVEAYFEDEFGWSVDVPGDSEDQHLRLMAGRLCLSGEGTVAHVLYWHGEEPLSLFVLPDKVEPSEIVEVMGHAAVIWPQNGRTYVLVGGESRAEMERIAEHYKKVLEQDGRIGFNQS